MDTTTIQTNIADYLAVLLLSQQYFTDDLYTQAKIFLRLIVNLWFSVNAETITSYQHVEEARDMLLAHLKESIQKETSALGVVHRLHLEWLNRRIAHWATLCYELDNSKVVAPEKQHEVEFMMHELTEQAKMVPNPQISSSLLQNINQVVSYHISVFGISGLHL
eukprot:Phypoly_transcript_05850.p1 GENE.Phypoly_transcript_05850~~Phypoly_transcript_05850.p1  ORF type:complete len:164 (+),score=19.18 Phypoly_transcript_05850:1186-1677(+)